MNTRQKNFYKNKISLYNIHNHNKLKTIPLFSKNYKAYQTINPYSKNIKKLHFYNFVFFKNFNYSKITSLCNKQGHYKRVFKHFYLNRHVLKKILSYGNGTKKNIFLKKKTW